LIHSSFCFNGRDFSIVQDDSIVMSAGNAIVTWNSSTGKKDYIWSKRNGYNVVTANYHKGYIAGAEFGMNPEVHIYKIPGKDLIWKFPADTKIRVSDMVFSRDGKYLLVLGGVPDFAISVFDVETGQKLRLIDNELPFKIGEYRKCKFNPQNSKEFAMLSEKSMYFFKITEAFEMISQDNQAELGLLYRLSYI